MPETPKPDNRDIRVLLSLLDDPDERVAVEAMGELLDREPELGETLAELQESSDPLLRRRSHQLQAAITVRRRRRSFLDLLYSPNLQLVDGLIEVHLQWFDNDARPFLEELWQKFRNRSADFMIQSLDSLSYFYHKLGMQAAPESTLVPENYCVGPILEHKVGASSILAAIGGELAAGSGCRVRLVRVLGEFALQDEAGALLFPGRGCQIERDPGKVNFEVWSQRKLLNYASLQLLSYAVNSDSFRYIQTIGQALSGAEDGAGLDFMPYPYFPADGDDSGNAGPESESEPEPLNPEDLS